MGYRNIWRVIKDYKWAFIAILVVIGLYIGTQYYRDKQFRETVAELQVQDCIDKYGFVTASIVSNDVDRQVDIALSKSFTGKKNKKIMIEGARTKAKLIKELSKEVPDCRAEVETLRKLNLNFPGDIEKTLKSQKIISKINLQKGIPSAAPPSGRRPPVTSTRLNPNPSSPVTPPRTKTQPQPITPAPPTRSIPAPGTPKPPGTSTSPVTTPRPPFTPPPTRTITTPGIPPVRTPTISTPSITTPPITIPGVITVPSVTTPSVTVPSITTPIISTPSITIPSIPQIVNGLKNPLAP